MDQNSKEFSLTGVSLKKRFPISNATAWLHLGTGWATRLLPLLVLLLVNLPTVAQALDYTYTTNNGAITITKYTGSGGAVTIPDTIDGLPVTSIEGLAFIGCINLTGVNIPNSVASIGGWAFDSCTSLTSVTIGNGVTNIGPGTFHSCTKLSAITVDALNSFYSGVDGVVFNKSQTTLMQCPEGKVGNYTIPNSISSIGNGAFMDCSRLTSITIPNSVTDIGPGAFSRCSSLTNILIGNSVASIEGWAFDSCSSLTSVTIGSSVSNIGTAAFRYCTKLSEITVDALNSFYSGVDGVLFNKSQTTLIQCPGGKAGSYTIPTSVTTIEVTAFSRCFSLANVVIGNGVTNIGSSTFDYCTNLTSVTIGSSVASIGGNAFSDCSSLTGVYFLGNAPGVGWSPFGGNTNVTVYYLAGTTGWGSTFAGRPAVLWNPQDWTDTVTNGAATITKYNGSGGAVTIPNSINGLPVTSIGDNAFDSCTSLTSITLPASVTSIGASAFTSCINLSGIMIPTSVISIGANAFLGCNSLTSVVIPDRVTSIGANAFHGCTSLTSVMLPNSVTSIGENAFSYCTHLISVAIGNGVTTIGDDAFSTCTNLNSVMIGNSVTSIETNAFYGCKSLTSVVIGISVTNIGNHAFMSCTGLTGVYFKGNAPSADPSALDGDSQLTVYYLAGTTGWGSTFAGRPTVLWNPPAPPQVQTGKDNFGVRSNRFGFTLTGTSGLVFVVEACTDLANPTWSALQIHTLSGDSFYFSDPEWTYFPGRFYRLRSQ